MNHLTTPSHHHAPSGLLTNAGQYVILVTLMSTSRKKDINLSGDEIDLLRNFVDREVENIKVFGPADIAYQKKNR